MNTQLVERLMDFKEYLAEKYPQFLLIEGSYINTKQLAQLQCKECREVWSITPGNFKNRGDKNYCPKCTPKIAHNRKNSGDFKIQINIKYPELILLEEYKTARTKITVGCKYGHTWQVDPSHLLNKGIGSSCRECAGLPTWGTKPPEFFAHEIETLYPHLKVIGEYKSAKSRINVMDKNCGHTWDILPNAILTDKSGSTCRICNPLTSRAEDEIYEFIKINYTGWIIRNDRNILEGRELDIVLPDLGLAIEYNGIYWHSEVSRERYYHKDKTDQVNSFEYQLFHIYEDMWLNNKELVKSKILSLLGVSTKIPARKCSIRETAYPKEFLSANHLQGAGSPTRYNYALYYYNELVAVMTFGKPRFNTEYDYELIRFCSLSGVTVIGGASKLLKYFRKQYKGSIISYSNRSWSKGNLYKKLGFVYSHTSEPNYKYYKSINSLSRYECQKHLLKTRFPDIYKDELTEAEIMQQAGYLKVYDSGNDVWVLK